MVEFGLDFCYENEKSPALNDVKGRITDGKCIVLCGDSGCGKTTLLRCINRLIPTFYEGQLKGFCHMNGQDISTLSVGEMGEHAASVFQDPRSHFFTINSSTEVAFGLENYGTPHAKMVERVDEAFSLFHLEKLKGRNVYELSSGEKQLISILSAWATDTDILFLDEPTANLDFAAIQQLHELLLMLKKEGKTILLSEHRLHYLKGVADEYWVMSGGEIVRQLAAEEILSLPGKKLSEMSLRTTDLDLVTLQTEQPPAPTRSLDTLTAQAITFGYKKKGGDILDRFSMKAHTGEVIGLIGSNGSGKTTFGKIAAGLLKPASGEILFNSTPMKAGELHKQSLFIMQEAELQFFTNSVMNELKYGRGDPPGLQSEIERLLKKFGMWEYRSRHPFSLSGGQMQKLTLMLACLSPKPILVLDEPTAGLDEKSLRNCVELIREIQPDKITLIITHDIELIAQVCTRCICLSSGSAQREFALQEEPSLKAVIKHMHESFHLTDNIRSPLLKQKPGRCDPRIKLLVLLVTMVAASTTNAPLILLTSVCVLALAFAERFYRSALIGGAVLVLLFTVSTLFPNGILSFFADFIPRLMVIWVGLETIIGQNEAAKTLAALRKYHVPEKVIMIVSVVFRFFPVLANDMKLMSQSVKTRGAFSGLREKLRALPEYIEILIVPMSLRVIRIAEALSASAETRGIDLKRKRSSYVALKLGAWDLFFLTALVGTVVAGIVI